MFIFPVVADAKLPPEFERHAVVPEAPLLVAPDVVEENRERWVDEWTRIVLR